MRRLILPTDAVPEADARANYQLDLWLRPPFGLAPSC
jgi:hypothetical protein